LLLAGSTAVLAYLAYGRAESEGSKQNSEAAQGASFNGSLSRGDAAIASSGDVGLESKGYIIPLHQIQVSPKVSGLIVNLRIRDAQGKPIKDENGNELFLEEGSRVKKDWILAELEDIDYKADRDHAQAALEEARQNLLELTEFREKEIEQMKARWEETQAQREQLERDRARLRKLRVANAVAEQELEKTTSDYLAMVRREKSLRLDYELLVKGPRDLRIEAAKRRIRQTDANLAKAQWRLDNCVIRAPISGTILTKIAEEGNIVNQLSYNLKGSLCDMADLADLEVDLSIQERDISRVFKGQRCKVRPEAYSDRVYDGAVSRLMPMADRAKGAVTVRVKLTVPRNEEGVYLKPDMGAVVSFMKNESY
jgi:multidrug resistance efflux pump